MKSSRIGIYETLFLRLLIALACAVLAISLLNHDTFQGIEARFYDMRLRLVSVKNLPSPEIVIVGIDEESLYRLEPTVGRWPWPRAVLASVMDYCSKAEAIAVDILIAEGDWQYQSSDQVYVDMVRRCGNVISATFADDRGMRGSEHASLERFTLSRDLGWPQNMAYYHGLVLPTPPLLDATYGLGHVNQIVDGDGVIRRHQVAVDGSGQIIPSLALGTALRVRGLRPQDIELTEENELVVGSSRIPLDEKGAFHMAMSQWDHRVYSMADLIESWRREQAGDKPPIPRETFKDKIVLMGGLAAGLMDQKATPVAAQQAGVEILASALECLLDGSYIRVLHGGWAAVLAILFSLALASRRLAGPKLMLPGVVSLIVLYGMIAIAMAFYWNIMIPILAPVGSLTLTSGALGSLLWAQERAHRNRLEALDEAKQAFTNMLVHDLKNNLAPIMMSVSVAEMEGIDDAYYKDEFTDVVKESCDRLLTKVNALLDIRRMQEGKLQVTEENILAVIWLEQVGSSFQATAERADKKLVYKHADDPECKIKMDVEIMRRVLENLIWNAIRYGRPGHDIVMGTQTDVAGRTGFYIANRSKVLSDEVRRNLFNPFITEKGSSRHRAIPSSGLGLAFCKLAVEAHGGTIEVESPWEEAGEGVRVKIWL